MKKKFFVYQILTRLFGNKIDTNLKNGEIWENGSGKFNDISDNVLKKLSDCGYTHIWYIGVLAHSTATNYEKYGIPHQYPEIVKGKAGSPYAVRDYYDVDPDLSVDIDKRLDEFDNLINRTHKAGLKVIIDFVPNHLARNYQSIAKPPSIADFGADDDKSLAFHPQNNFYYIPDQALDLSRIKRKNQQITYTEFPAKATGNDCFTNSPSLYDWYETVKLNYGVDYLNGRTSYFSPIPDTWIKMRDVLLFWASRKVDGFRCDMAEMVPLQFWKWVIPQIKSKYLNIIFIAETYNPSEYRNYLAENTFDYLYDKVGLYDVLRDVASGYRSASDITFSLNQVGDIQHHMINFMENHDEQRIASDYFLKDGKKGKAAMIVTSCINVNPVMVYFGQELGEPGMDEEGFSGRNGRTTIYDYWSIDKIRRWNNNGKWNKELLTKDEIELQSFYKKLILLCNQQNALSEGLFYDLMSANYENPGFNSMKQYAFARSDGKDFLIVVANFSEKDETITLYTPDDVFRFFGFNIPGNCQAMPLLAENEDKFIFNYYSPFKVRLAANDGEIYKISFL